MSGKSDVSHERSRSRPGRCAEYIFKAIEAEQVSFSWPLCVWSMIIVSKCNRNPAYVASITVKINEKFGSTDRLLPCFFFESAVCCLLPFKR